MSWRRRYVDPLSLEIIEQWLNAYVRTKPSFHSGVILSVDIQKPKQVLQKISAGNDLSDQERIKLLEWAAFELNTRVDPEIETLIKAVVIGKQLNAADRQRA